MNFSEVIKELGIEKYPDGLPKIFDEGSRTLDVSPEALDRIEKEYSVIGERLAELKKCAEEVLKNIALTEYTRAAVAFLREANHHEGGRLALPTLDTNGALYHYPIMVLSFAIPAGIEKYRARGFEEDEVKGFINSYRARINSKDAKTQKPTVTAYNWLRHYSAALLFGAGLFSVTPRIIDAPIIILKNEKKEYKIVVTGGKYHKSGKPLGNACCKDEEGSFMAEFSEDEKSYTGHEVINSSVSQEVSFIKKDEWKEVAKKGDWIVALHIPRGADLSEESMTRGFHDAMDKTKRLYADLDPKLVHCSTWLLSPKLAELQGEGSGIARFSGRFIKYPIGSGGKELFGFAFPVCPDDYNDLPEDTSLRRKLKALYLSGGCIHAHAGFVPESDEWK